MIKSSHEHEQVKGHLIADAVPILNSHFQRHLEDEVMHVDAELASLPKIDKNNSSETK
jgi:hypothetical protein